MFVRVKLKVVTVIKLTTFGMIFICKIFGTILTYKLLLNFPKHAVRSVSEDDFSGMLRHVVC